MIVAYASYLAGKGHDVVIRSNHVDTVFEIDTRVRVEPMSYPGKAGTILSAIVERHAVDLIIADIIPLVCLLLIRNRGRVLFFAQGYDESYCSGAVWRYFIRTLYLLGLFLFRVRTVAVDFRLAAYLRRAFRAEVAVVENGIDTAVFYPDPAEELVRGKAQRKAVLILSRSDPPKGFDVGVSALAALSSRIPGGLEVWTVGESGGGHFPGVPHRDFGYVDEHALRRIMSSADLLLYPSRQEGFGLMVLEAFACRCPVVTTDAVSYVCHRKNALVAGIGEADLLADLTAELFASDELRVRLVDAGYLFSMQHSLPKSMAAFESSLMASLS